MTLRFKVEGQNTPASLLMLGKPAGEGARRVQLMRELRGPEQLLVDGGNILEGLSSVATGQLSRQRENSLQAIQNLGYDAIAVGKNELRGGLAQLQQEQQQWGLPLLSANLLQAGKPLFKPWKLMRLGQKSLLLIGLTDGEDVQSLQEQGILPSDLSLEQPSKAVADALTDAYLQLGRTPDVVVVLTNIDGDGLRELEYLQDVQLVQQHGPTAPGQ
jgi:2',3'-cyclic-nucleotide 2'-phosphodiesterase (5'-nucleotidase family)